MFVDASALTAILTDEDEARALATRLQQVPRRLTSPLAVWESALAVARRLDLPVEDAHEAVRDYLALAGIEVLAVPAEAAGRAIEAFSRYGKGRHPAALTVGDCFAYACARHYGAPLLYKGDDFARTDIEAA